MYTSRKAFLRDFYSIKVGMSQNEVQSIMGKYITGTGWPAYGMNPGDHGELAEAGSNREFQTTANQQGELELRNSVVYRHSRDGRYDSDWGVVKFENGRVVGIEFLPD